MRHTHCALALLAAASLAAPGAIAQGQGQSRGQAPTPPGAGAVDFADTPFRVPSLGLTMWLPVGSQIDTTNLLGGESTFQIVAPNRNWMLRGFTSASRDTGLTPAGVVESLVEGLLNPGDVRNSLKDWNVDIAGAKGALLDRTETLNLADLPASRCYVALERPDGTQVISGYTVIRLSPGNFLLFELTCAEAEYEDARPVYEAIVGATEIRDPGEAAQERAAGVIAADRLLEGLNREDFASMLDSEPRYFRLYRPAAGGADGDAEEVAYQRVVLSEGQRGELDPQKAPGRWTAADRQHGYVVRIDGRFLDADRVIDSRSVFFLSLDREEEAWTVRMRVRDSKRREQNFTETGVRLGDDIKVTVDQPGQPATLGQWKRPPEGYASQVETYLMPRILVRFGAPSVFNVYRYNSATSELTMRTDELTPLDGGQGWSLLTKPHADAPTEVTVLDEQGRIVRRVMPTGIVMEPVPLERLKRLWTGKGLPID
ncbi:MAG: hypothetical protein ACF8QF_06910 [Phycisphaerales bacterium]